MNLTGELTACGTQNLKTSLMRAALISLALFVVLILLPSRALADGIVISLQENGGAITTVGSGIGSASFSGLFGDFTFNSVTGVGSPYLAEPGLQSTSIDIAGGTGNAVLNVFVTEQGLTSPTGVNSFLSTFTSQLFSGNIASVMEQTFIGDPGSGTLLASQTFTGLGTSSSVNSTPSLSGPYDETVEYTITTTGAGSVNDSIQIASAPVSTPEPSTLLLVGLGLGGLLLFGKRMRHAMLA